jgi:HD-like signal output (HDOD) protein
MFFAQSMRSPGKIGSLISAPHVVVQLLGACREPATASGELAEIVLQDGVMCAKIIDAAAKVCPDSLDPASPVTSALAGLTQPIVKSLALQSAKALAASRFTPEQAHFLRRLWFFSRAAGCIAHATAEAVAYPAPEEAQVTAQLMNIGMLALFSHNPEKYVQNIDSQFSSKEVRVQEQVCFEVDHLQLAEILISGWGGDSFMLEAILFAHHDPESSRASSTLVRIAQLANEIGRNPLILQTAGLRKAEQLFDLKETATTALFRRAESQYRDSSPFECRPDESMQELDKAGKHLTDLAFDLLEQETVRCQLAGAEETVEHVFSARQLYLHHSPALEAVFFLVDRPGDRLVGFPSAPQSRLFAELTTPLTVANLLTAAAQEGRLRHSFEAGATLTVFDRQLIRVCKGRGIACLPLRMGDRPVGGVVLGLGTPGAVASLDTPHLDWLTRALASTLAALSNETAAGRALEGRDIDPIPRLAHEIGNPLAIINNYMHVLGNLLEGSENAGIPSAVVKEVERIDEILTYYRTTIDSPKPPNSGVEFNATIFSVLESLRPALFDPKKIEVVTDFDTAIGSASTNPLAIKQILVNLLTNAAEAVAEHGRIVITSREQIRSDGRRYVVIGVKDNGPGIDKRIMGGLFSPVASTKGGNHAGLGLSIAKEMADDIGAILHCHSNLVSGTYFSLMVPLAD